MKLKRGLVQIYFGNGKGKTTAALGLVVRALGAGLKVHLIQFMKSRPSSELNALKKFKNFSYNQFGPGIWYSSKDKNSIEKHEISANEALGHLSQALKKKYDLIIADEILYALQFNLIKEAQVVDIIKSKQRNIELVLTGSHKPFPNLFKLADLVTEVKKIKHPFDSGIKARKGIEY